MIQVNLNEKLYIDNLINSVDEQYKYFKENKLPIGKVWKDRITDNFQKLKSNPELIHKFNKIALTGIGDNYNRFNRSAKYDINHLFYMLIKHYPSSIELMLKYSADTVGERGIYKKKYNGNTFVTSALYIQQIEKLSIFNDNIKDKINNNFISCDIGSNSGIYSMLLKKEYHDVSLVLIDFPEQLLYAHYYLKHMFNDPKIATFSDIKNLKIIDRSFIERYDFVLVPSYIAHRIKSVDVVTNFASLGEMTREWFDYYIKSDFFKNAKFFFHQNRIHKDYGYGYSITILDYPHADFETILFEVSPLFQFIFSTNKIFVKKDHHQPLFNFVGKRM